MNEKVRILLVEDEQTDAELALLALQEAGLSGRVRHVWDGQEALDYLFGEGPFEGRPGAPGLRLVLLDLNLPKVDGLDVLTRLRADPRTRSIPVVVLTSSMLRADVEKAYRAGANSLVVKPVNFGDHSQALQTIGTYWMEINVAPPE